MDLSYLKKQFERDGYIHVRNVLTAKEVSILRNRVRSIFEQSQGQQVLGDDPHCIHHIWARFPDLRWLLYRSFTCSVLKAILSEKFVVLRESCIHRNWFTGWHKDTQALEQEGLLFHLEKDFQMVEVVYYLQDNSEEFGGGIDVEPASHHDKYGGFYPIETPLLKFKKPSNPKGLSVPTLAGDLVVFHFCINHKGTTPKVQPLPPGKEKFAIFMACSTPTPYVQKYHDFSLTRRYYEYLKDFYYPKELVLRARESGIFLV